jgi:cyclopropane fatty-acyl-phospholipid synthase-like methyltransferase
MQLSVPMLSVGIRRELSEISLSQDLLNTSTWYTKYQSNYDSVFVSIGRRACEQLKEQHASEFFERVSSNLEGGGNSWAAA